MTVTVGGVTSATSSADVFTYVAPAANAPAVEFLFPSSGPMNQYTLVFIFGKNFNDVKSLMFGANAGLFRVLNRNLLVGLAPPAKAAGTVPVTVTTAAGSSAASSHATFTYTKGFTWSWGW